MIQDIYPHQFNNDFVLTSSIHESDYIFYFKENALLMKQSGEALQVPQRKDLVVGDVEGIFLFTFNNEHCFLIWELAQEEDEILVYHDIHVRNPFVQKELDWVTSVALQLKNWYLQHKFCGVCGAENKPKVDERAVVCTSCETTKYPYISPAIIVAIFNDDEILLARNVNFPDGFYSIIAGYVDVGETIEDTIKREAMEEVGLKVKNIRYYKSQPWPFSGSMMLGFIAELDGDSTVQVDGKEIAEAGWYKRNNLPNYPPDRSIAGEIIEKFINNELLV